MFLLFLIALLIWAVWNIIHIGRRDRTLPPGPPTLPLLGNIHTFPTKFPFLRFTQWSKEYGGILSLKVANKTIIVLSDNNIVKELLDDRSSETSSRPVFHALDAVAGKSFFALLPSANPVWKVSRKAVQASLAPQASLKHIAILETETTRLLFDLLHTPEELCSHVFRFAFSSITSIAFGKEVPKHNSPEAKMFEEYLRYFLKAVSAEAAPVDLLPALRYVPERWAPWKQLWRKTQMLQQSLYFSFLAHTEHKFNNGKKSGSIIEAMLEQQERLQISRELVGYTGGVLLDAGTETTSTMIQSILLCLIKSPECLQKAQTEIDEIVGDQRLPILSDIHGLPFVQAIIKEVHRLRPALPTGVPHAAYNDIQYRGYVIPKGAPILVNTWGILHDPDLFERPDDFWPERYLLTPNGTKPGLDKDNSVRSSLHFGSGKRICPGMHFGNNSLSLAIMRLLWAFDFVRVDDSVLDSSKSDITEEYAEGITFSPKRFGCLITPRSKDKVGIIEDHHNQLAHLD